MTVALSVAQPLSSAPALDRALGESARIVRRIRADAFGSETAMTTGVRRQEIVRALETASAVAQEPSWDGYGAQPLQPATIAHAFQFLSQLPASFPTPQVAIDSDGDVAIEWDIAPRRVISVRVAPDGTLNYAGIAGHSVFHGVEPSREGIPSAVVSAISRVVAIAAA
jgi:hypothetical protein